MINDINLLPDQAGKVVGKKKKSGSKLLPVLLIIFLLLLVMGAGYLGMLMLNAQATADNEALTAELQALSTQDSENDAERLQNQVKYETEIIDAVSKDRWDLLAVLNDIDNSIPDSNTLIKVALGEEHDVEIEGVSTNKYSIAAFQANLSASDNIKHVFLETVENTDEEDAYSEYGNWHFIISMDYGITGGTEDE
jgi:Tfp pilus assembly protein PilN